jgi:hypothetical protein
VTLPTQPVPTQSKNLIRTSRGCVSVLTQVPEAPRYFPSGHVLHPGGPPEAGHARQL